MDIKTLSRSERKCDISTQAIATSLAVQYGLACMEMSYCCTVEIQRVLKTKFRVSLMRRLPCKRLTIIL